MSKSQSEYKINIVIYLAVDIFFAFIVVVHIEQFSQENATKKQGANMQAHCVTEEFLLICIPHNCQWEKVRVT